MATGYCMEPRICPSFMEEEWGTLTDDDDRSAE